MTHARTKLYLRVPQVTGHGARLWETAPSPFLAQIPDQLPTIAAPTAPQGEQPAAVTRGPLSSVPGITPIDSTGYGGLH